MKPIIKLLREELDKEIDVINGLLTYDQTAALDARISLGLEYIDALLTVLERLEGSK